MPLTSANNAIAAAKRARKPPVRAVEKVHKKFGGKSHPHMGHTWQSKAKKKRVYVRGRYSKTGAWIKPHYKYVTVKS